MRRLSVWTFGLFAYFAIVGLVTFHWPPWGDEAHYLNAVRLFGRGITIDTLRTYPEMAGPLTFVVYSLWGRLAGFDTSHLRPLSTVLAFVTSVLLVLELRRHSISAGAIAAGTLSIIANPYFIGLSAFVFSDMLALCLMMMVATGISRDRPWLTGVGVAGALVTRQFLVFLVPAIVIAVALSTRDRAPRRNRHLFAACVGMLPLAGMVWLWGGGLSPIADTRHYVADGVRFDPHSLSLYLAVPGIYLAPLLVWGARQGMALRAAAGGVLALLTLMFPVQPSRIQLAEGATTVGFAHRAFTALLPAPAVNLAWFVAAAVACTVVAEHLRLWLRSWPYERTVASIFPWSGILCFLLVMPFSYMPWEKYALPLLLFMVLALCRDSSAILLEDPAHGSRSAAIGSMRDARRAGR